MFDSINSNSHVESCIPMDHRELLMASACLVPTLMIYDVYMSEIILFNLHTLQLDIASSMCTFFQDRKGHKELSDRYCITFILNFINCFIHTGQHWLLSQSVLWPLHMCNPCGYIYICHCRVTLKLICDPQPVN